MLCPIELRAHRGGKAYYTAWVWIPDVREELRQLKRLRRESSASRFVFCSKRGGPLTIRSVHHVVKRAGREARLDFPVHPHMLRHAKGFQLAQKGTDTRAIQGYLDHRDVKSTVVYMQLDPRRFKGLQND